ncbi:hypothetical protein [Streptomyces sp. NPDC059761]|uniref:hypothetical protein n=1 Tax=Streptomyces sp. NPDC059761 TaxID=3346937 RepID=UPI00364AD6AF
MSYTVTLKPGLTGVALPNGRLYQGGEVAVLTDTQYARLSATAPAALFTSSVHTVDGADGSPGALLLANNLSDLANKPTARSNLGLTAVATASAGALADVLAPNATPSAGSTGRYADAGHVHLGHRYTPEEHGLLAWTGDPGQAGTVTSQTAAGVAGRITLVKIPIRRQITWSEIWAGVAGVDGAATLANNYLGVYDASGNLKGVSADISSLLLSNPISKPFALTTPFVADPGYYFIALLMNGTWTQNQLTLKSTGAGITANSKLSAPNLRFSSILTGQTSLPATLNMNSQTTNTISGGWGSQWYGVG